MALKKWNTRFPFGIFHPEKQDYQMFLCSRKFFRWENPKSLVPFTRTFQPDFPENFCKW